uniref:50S ribosomal protein L7/L12 n=1 Tax=Rhizophora mucronata TaxID=61149 RepID=A0A2P2LDR9_RHIMU
MRLFRFISPRFSRIPKTHLQNLTFTTQTRSKSHTLTRRFTTASQSEKNTAAPSERVAAIVEEFSGLTLLEASDLVEALRGKLDAKEMPLMAMMMPGMQFGGFQGAVRGGAGAAAASAGKGEEKMEKTSFDLKLEGFDAAAKLKVIKELRSFTDLGLKEAKELVEKAPAMIKRGVPKEDAEKILEKMKAAGAKVTIE